MRIFFRFYIEDGSHCMFIAVQIASQFEEPDQSGPMQCAAYRENPLPIGEMSYWIKTRDSFFFFNYPNNNMCISTLY